MNAAPPKIVAGDATTVTLDRAEWEEYLEDIAHRAAVDVFDAHVAEVGLDEVIRLGYSGAESLRMIHGVSPIVIWRERMKLSQREAAAKAGISPSYLAEIETGKKPGSVAAITALARLFNVPMEHLLR